MNKVLYKFYSANGVPWPLDDYLYSQGKPTIEDMVDRYTHFLSNRVIIEENNMHDNNNCKDN